jgi:hypothetical protein
MKRRITSRMSFFLEDARIGLSPAIAVVDLID